MTPVHRPRARHAFTLLEMLVVIGIITLLAAILIPVVSQVRMRAFVAQTQGEMQRIMTACTTYYSDFHAYPGPLANNMLVGAQSPVDSRLTVDPQANPKPNFDSTKITSSENLMLGLLGLLSPYPAPPGPNNPTGLYLPPPPKHDVLGLNFNRPASYHFLDFLPDEIPTSMNVDYYAYGTLGSSPPTDMTGSTATSNGTAASEGGNDSTVPEFMDHIPTPMPILYMRPIPGAAGICDAGDQLVPAPYNYMQLAPYGFKNVNLPDYQPPTGYTDMHNGWDTYLMNPSIPGQPRGKDAFILIDAGPDRLFGTKDDIIVTP
jgi:prepilin-type N-terminal cleavage/methylation domain-containing protein